MPTSSEIEREIRQRAERRKQELLEALRGGVLGQSKISSNDKASVQKGLDMPVTWAEMRRRSAGGKENESPKRVSDLLYPARPARSVYNSPLIKTNRSPLWKSPLSCADLSLSPNGLGTSSSRDELKAKSQELGALSTSISTEPTAPLLSDFSPRKNTLLSKDQRLYPSLPRAGPDEGLKSPNEEKKIKEQCNRLTANASRKSSHDSFVHSVRSKFENINNTPLTTFTGDNTSDGYSFGKNSEDDIEDTYDMDRFLEEALGSALHLNSTIADDRSTDFSAEDSLHSIESYRTPTKICPTSTVRSSVRLSKPTPVPAAGTYSIAKSAVHNDKVSHLLKDADAHQQVIAQASKALTICRSSKTFFNSSSLVDAERLLLLATMRHKAVLDDIRGLLPHPESTKDFKGRLCASEISAQIKGDSLKWGKTENDKDLWFLCVLSHGQEVIASEAVAYEPGVKFITFTSKLELSNLSASFVALLQIYTLRTYKPQLSHKSKLSKACKLLRRRSKSCLDHTGSSEQLLHLRTPAFALSGSVSVDLSQISSTQPQTLQLDKVPIMSPLRGSVSVRLSTCLTNSIELSGFLTILEKVGLRSHAWQRRWCHLSDLRLHFWNYPADQDEKVPIDIIDLRCCSSEKVEVAPRHLCARSRTVMLETTRLSSPYDMNSTIMECNSDTTVVRYFLSFDSAKEMSEWVSVLNQVLSSIKEWNLKECIMHA
ncbi:anillin-like [Thrips palmi]|uniref:Anillin-like n=1 Tax=Thrips palmi TaxID=161013 RepID=A0A6P8YGK9_THRPL|nr:anillin-like [Thrips palmi]XP_034235676.1 anillin-like [Thrips palmi]